MKIGFHTALKLLHAGATVIVTSRFRVDTLERFKGMSDFAKWKDRLVILGCDLRFLPRVEELCDFLWKVRIFFCERMHIARFLSFGCYKALREKEIERLTAQRFVVVVRPPGRITRLFLKIFCQEFDHLDVVIHNACQTIRRPYDYYKPLREKEIEWTARFAALEDGCIQGQEESLQQDTKIMIPKGTFVSYGKEQASPTAATGTTLAENVSSKNTDLIARNDDEDMAGTLLTEEDRTVALGSSQLPGHTDVNGQLIDYRSSHSW